MKARRIWTTVLVAALMAAPGQVSGQTSMGTAFTYQGRLTDGGSPANDDYDFEFKLYDAEPVGTGNQVGSTVPVDDQTVTNGLFTARLDFGEGIFGSAALWLEIGVRDGASTGAYTTLDPRQELTPTPYALALPGLRTEQEGTNAPNIIGGLSGNWVAADVYGATISGGGYGAFPNRVTDRYGTVGGGYANQAGDDAGSTSDAPYATIAGGIFNEASADYATVAGGYSNSATSDEATVGGGVGNDATGNVATIGGGFFNVASGGASTVPGGAENTAGGAYSYAAGRRAQANHDGSFVWSDRTTLDPDFFNSTGDNQFLINATGGVGIGIDSPQADLHVAGDIRVGSSTETGLLQVFLNGSANPVVKATNYSTHGGAVNLYDDLGNKTVIIRPDESGTGGILQVYRDASSHVGFEVNGNLGGSEEPVVTIWGSARSAQFNMNNSGDDSVQLPVDAISAPEVLDEPGVASATEGFSGVVLTGGVDTLLSRTITVPAGGYVLVIGTCQARISHSNGTNSDANFGVSDSAGSFPANQNVVFRLHSGLPTGDYDFPVTVHGLFSVSTGANTFYFLADEGFGSFIIYNMQLTLVYLPTAYGTVSSTMLSGQGGAADADAPARPALSQADIDAERAEAEAFNAARIKKELEAMQVTQTDRFYAAMSFSRRRSTRRS